MERDRYLEALLSLPRLLYPHVSPDGRWVAWSWMGAGAAIDVYVAPTDASAPPVRLTDTPDHTLIASWTPDSSAILATEDHRGDERYRLYRLEVNSPGAATLLTDASPNYFLRGGQLHPNGRWLVYAANVDISTGREIEPTWVYRHDLVSGERKVLARPEKPAGYIPSMNIQGTHILYNRKDLHPSGQQVWIVDIEGKDDREIFNFGPEVKCSASWFPDGVRALVLAETGTHVRIGVWNRETGRLTWVLDDPSRYIFTAFVPLNSDRIVVVGIENAGIRSSLLDADSGEEQSLPSTPGNLLPVAPAASGDWVGQYYSARQPADLVRFPLSTEKIEPERFISITGVWNRTTLHPDDLATAQSIQWKSSDGLEIQGWLYRPQGTAKGTIVYVHGGPTSHSENRLNSQVQFFVSQGFNVLDPNYRGSTGFGLPFREAIKVDGWGAAEQDDIRTGIESLIAQGIAEPGRVGITGTSYGGYSAWWGITHWPVNVLAASAPVCGMTDLVVDYHTTRPDLRPYSEEMLGGTPDSVPDRYKERSPINFVGNIKGKLLIVQGMQDPNVTPENVRAVEVALKQAGVAYELMAFEDEGHGVYRPENQKTLYLRLADFFSEALPEADKGTGTSR